MWSYIKFLPIQLELLNLLKRQFYKFRELQQASYAITRKGDFYSSDARGAVRLDYCKLHIMTAKYFLASKSSLLIFLGHNTFCFIFSSVPLILLMSFVHFGLLFLFSLSNHFKSPFLHKACLPWSYFYLLFFALFFLFLYLHTHHHCLWFIFQSFHSNFSKNLCLSFTSTNQEPLLCSTGHSFILLGCQYQLPFLLPQPKIPTPIYPLQVLLMSFWILFRQDPPKVNSPKGWPQHKGKGVLILTYTYCFCSCLQQPTAAIALKNLLKYQELSMLK